MSIENNSLNSGSVNQLELEKNRNIVKKMIWECIDTLTPVRVRELLDDPRPLESFLFGLINEKDKEIHLRNKNVKYLKQFVGGMINMTPSLKINEIIKTPDRFFSVLKGEVFNISKTQEKETKAIPERIATFDQIKKAMGFLWQTFDWGNVKNIKSPTTILETVKRDFREMGFSVKVEFLDQYDPEHGNNYIVISENKESGGRGIVVPRYGIELDFPFNSGCFVKPGPEMKFPVTEIVEFPEIERDFTYNINNPSWKVTKLGKIKIPEVV